MICRFKRFVSAFFLISAGLASMPADALDQGQLPDAARTLSRSIELPAEFAAHSLGHDLQVNGRPVSIWKVTASGRTTDAVASVHAHWQARASEPVQRTVDAGWHIVSRRTRAGYETAQLRDHAGQVEGYLAHWHSLPPTSRATVNVNPWLPRSVRVESEVVSPNPTTRVTTWVGASPDSAAVLIEAIGDIARAKGLKPAAGPNSVPGIAVARFTGRSREWVVTLESNSNGTAVVAHLTEPRP
jgi:hypothetical protein